MPRIDAKDAIGAIKEKRQSKSERTQQQLMEAALRVIGAKGYEGATMNAIAKEAGMAKGVAYYHFKNKEALAAAILEKGLRDLTLKFNGIYQDSANSMEAISTFIEEFCNIFLDNVDLARFFIAEFWREERLFSPELSTAEEEFVAMLENVIACGQKEGSIRAEIRPTFAAIAIVGMGLTTTLRYTKERLAHPENAQELKDEQLSSITDFVAAALSA